MISRSIISSPKDAASYYSDLAKAAEYYGGETVPSQWLGQGAELQSLNGPVIEEDLVQQLEGKVIDSTGERQLGVFRNGELQHRAGYDFTVSAPKSVSIEALVFDNKAVLEAHNAAVKEAFNYLESNAAQSRINGKMVQTGNLTAASYQHVSSRAGDPQLHTHLLISNVTFDNHGKAYSLSSERLFQFRTTADSVYHNRLSHELQRLGYNVNHDRNGHVELANYSADSIRDFSTRTKEITDALQARGFTVESAPHALKESVKLSTRQSKNLPETREAHADRWRSQAEALNVTPAAAQAPANEPEPSESAHAALSQAIAHLSERTAIWNERDLHSEAARFSGGGATWGDISEAIEAAESRGDLLRESTHGEPARFTTASARAAETSMISALEAGRGSHQSIMNPREFDAALARYEASKGFTLTNEQRGAAEMILTGRDTFQSIQGLAGTGKTTLLEFVGTAAESKGWRVIGHSNGASQAATLQRESGIESTTTASHLLTAEGAKPSRDLTRELRIMDEAGLAGQRDFSRVLATTESAGARTVFLGDAMQHQSVEAGRSFELASAHMPTATLGRDSIRRQRTPETRQAVAHILGGSHEKAVKSIPCVTATQAQDALPTAASRDDRRTAARADNSRVIQRLAADYASLRPVDRERTLVLTSTNRDRAALNSAIRAELKSHGELGPGTEARTLTKVGLTRQKLQHAANFSPGQVVELQADSRRQELARGSQWTITGQRAGSLEVMDASGHSRTIDPSRCRLQVYAVDRRELSVGDRLRWSENHRAQRADRPLEPGLVVKNGESCTVADVSPGRVTLVTSDGEAIKIDPSSPQKLDYAYVSTSHSAQGRTVDSVMIHHNTEAGAHGQREAYVDLTRARDSVTLYTQDAEKAASQSGLALDKSAALDLAPDTPAPTPDRPHAPEPTRDDSPQIG